MRQRRDRHSERGLSLFEVLLGAILLTVATGAMVTGLVLSRAVDRDGNRRHAAMEAVLSVADEIRSTPIDSVEAAFGAGSPSGGAFAIPAIDDEDDVPSGRVIVITDETLTDEDVGMQLGMPRDLDGDDLTETTDVSTTALLLPVIVEARWGPPGRREVFRVPVVLIR
jgi:hypothetical protein